MTAPASLTVSFSQLQALVGFYAYGVRSTPSDSAQLANVNAFIQEGLQSVYTPMPIEPGGKAHEWSFMWPKYPITTVSGTYTYDLPANFGGIRGKLEYAPGVSVYYPPIPVVQLNTIQQRLADLLLTFHPEMAALEPIVLDPTVGTTWKLWLYPIPDAVYTLSFTMKAMPFMLDATNQYPLGADTLALVIQEACLAAAERNLDERSDGPHNQRFREMLVAAVKADGQSMSPDTLGTMCVPDNERQPDMNSRFLTGAVMTYTDSNGVIYPS